MESRFKTVLIANRGEIAVRIARAARSLGLRSAAVWSDADRDAPHVAAADVATRLGPSEAAASYLSIDALLDAARRVGAEAVHPGYGFLAESADFADACEAAGLVFIGPPAEAIRAMGDKSAARERMDLAGVPVAPGFQLPPRDDGALEALLELGFPLLIKAAAGGGGRGMRRVERVEDLASALASARVEAVRAFGSRELLAERFIEGARHVEVQILADGHGNVVHLGERDCSVQRRYQKVIEECPSPAVDTKLRAALGAAAVRAARAVDYVGAGTVEFLLADDGTFYFLEMNTRIQVEHPVTEMVVRAADAELDLVAWQLRVAAGERLDFAQEDVRLGGWAMEARLYAEDPAMDFAPQPGRVVLWRAPRIDRAQGDGVRVDAGITTGSEISPHYDPMVAKLIAHGADREMARRRLARALEECLLFGPTTNKAFLLDILDHPTFAAGEATTTFLGRQPPFRRPSPSPALRALGAVLLAEIDRRPDDPLWGFRTSGAAAWPLELNWGEETAKCRVTLGAAGYRVAMEGSEHEVEILARGTEFGGDWRARVDHEELRVAAHRDASTGELFLDDGRGAWRFFEASAARRDVEPSSGEIRAPMHGRVVEVLCTPGERVEAGSDLVVLEAMKLLSRVAAPSGGVVEAVRVAVGDQVAYRDVLVILGAAQSSGEKNHED